MTKTNRRSTSTLSRKSPSRRLASKTARRSSIKSKLGSKIAAAPRSKARKPVARRLVSRVKRTVSNAIGSR